MTTNSLRETIEQMRTNWTRRGALWVRSGRLRRRAVERRLLGQLVRGLERMQARLDRRLSALSAGRAAPPAEATQVAPPVGPSP
jgi:hypothetical protein